MKIIFDLESLTKTDISTSSPNTSSHELIKLYDWKIDRFLFLSTK